MIKRHHEDLCMRLCSENMDHKYILDLEVEKCCSMCKGDTKDKLKWHLRYMGFKDEQISPAIKICGLQSCSGLNDCVCLQSSLYHLIDFINAHLGGDEERLPLNSNLDDDEETLPLDSNLGGDEERLPLDSSTSHSEVPANILSLDTKMRLLLEMGYELDGILHAINTCGEESEIEVLVDCIYANDDTMVLDSSIDVKGPQSSGSNNLYMPSYCGMNDDDHYLSDASYESSEEEIGIQGVDSVPFSSVLKKNSLKRKHVVEEVQKLDEDNFENDIAYYMRQQYGDAGRIKRGMCGFSLPGGTFLRGRTVNPLMKGPPYFYFENVALMPKSEWDTITRFFNGTEPEFVDSLLFSACHRQRGYVHNLPIEGREVVQPKPPMTIQEAFPRKMEFRPCWDNRTKMNCINTVRSKNTVCAEIANTMSRFGNDPPLQEQKKVLTLLKKYNLLWVNPGLVAPLEPVEMEVLLGFDEEHTRGASTMTERYKALGNSFQVDTVAYHLSALRPLYARGIKVLSLFSGIGGAEVALHKAGIQLEVVVSVEGNPRSRDVLTSWWRRTGQKGRLIHRDDVQALSHDYLSSLINDIGGFDLVIGGSPCNNLTGSNRVTRVGLQGDHSRLFFEFPRIYNLVKQLQVGVPGPHD